MDYRIVVEEVPKADVDERGGHIAKIVSTTANTWQPGRALKEKADDTVLGKAAEMAFERYCAREGLSLLSWDEIRNDDFQTHSSLDGFLAARETGQRLRSDAFIRTARDSKPAGAAYFAPRFLRWCGQARVYGYEVKSTRIKEPRLMKDGEIKFAAILRDDFLVYPRVRTVSEEEFTGELRADLMRPAEVEKIRAKTPHLLVRAYMQEEADRYRAHLIRWIWRDDFFSRPLSLERMWQGGKSEKALYYKVPLSQGRPLHELAQAIQD